MKYVGQIYSDAEIKLIKEIFDMYMKQIYDEDLKDLINQCKEMFLDNQKLMKENKRLNNIINELERELDRGYLDLFEHELVLGRELITNIKIIYKN